MKIIAIHCFLVVLLALTKNIYSQTSINSGGNTATSQAGTISYSIGQTFVHTTENAVGTIHRGVQQPIRVETETNIVGALRETPLQVFPNPVTDKLQVTSCKLQVGDIVELFDMNGQRVFSASVGALRATPLHGDTFTIDMSHLPNGTYILRITQQGREVAVKRVIKM